MSTPSGELPPPPSPTTPTAGPTQIVGQQTQPSSTVPHTPNLQAPAGQSTQTNTLAIISIVAGIGSFFAHIIPGIGGFTVAIVAVVTGYMARNQIKQTGEQGMGLATAGMIIGIIHLGLIVLIVIGIIVLIFVFGVALFGISRTSSG